MMGSFEFRDRREAGQRLARELESYRAASPLILALPRGGVPVAAEVAAALAAPLDVVLVRKIGAPGNEELALGAIVDGANPQLVLNEEVVASVRPSKEYLEAAEKRALEEIERRRQLYCGDRPAFDIGGRVVIVIDDGIATGASIKAALRALRSSRPQRLVLAVPVAAPGTLDELTRECDTVICLLTPQRFYAVGAFYERFDQLFDSDVLRLLAEARRQGQAA
jgi:putative phosphoribosyl transferase